jgi:thiamine-phosphate pyrophosphorylase
MDSSPILRMVDSNLNRLAEGLRILEDVARMVLDDVDLTQQLKSLRHNLIRADLSFNVELLNSRDSTADVGVTLEVAGEGKQKDLPLIVVANSRRSQESLRELEELAKMPEMASRLDSDMFKKARFDLYTIEQKVTSRLLRQDKAKKISGLYVIIDTQALRGKNPLEATRQVIAAGVKVIQFRDKTQPKKLVIPNAAEILDLCRQNDVLFIMNDYLDVALAVDADGLHIGQDDLPFEVARRLLPLDKVLGCSVFTPEQTLEAEAAGADYIAVGSIYPTSSKGDANVVGVERLRQVKKVARTPVVAIGGINLNNAREVIECGADSLCVISAVLNAVDITRSAREIIKIIEDN